MKFAFVILLIAAAGATASYVAWRLEWIARKPLFRWSGLGLFVVLLVVMRLSMRELRPSDVLLIVMGCIWWAPFLVLFAAEVIAGATRKALSLDDMRVPPAYSLAEAAAAQKDYDQALRLYHEIAVQHPDEPETYTRMAEIFLKLNLPEDAISCFRDAMAHEQIPANKLLLVFAIAETLVERKKDVPSAIREIAIFLKEHPEVEGRQYAEARIDRMVAQLAGQDKDEA